MILESSGIKILAKISPAKWGPTADYKYEIVNSLDCTKLFVLIQLNIWVLCLRLKPNKIRIMRCNRKLLYYRQNPMSYTVSVLNLL